MLMKTLIRESTTNDAISNGRPAIAGIAKKCSSKIFSSLVSTVPTSLPVATVFAIKRWANDEDVLGAQSNVTCVNDGSIPDIADLVDSTVEKGSSFFAYDALYTAVVDFNIEDKVPTERNVNELMFQNKIVPIANASKFDQKITVSRVQAPVQSHLTSFSATTELLEDLDRSGVSGMSSDEVIADIVSTTISEVTNRDIIDTLKSIAVKVPTLVVTDNVYEQSRHIITHANRLAAQILTDTRVQSTFVLCSPKVAAALKSSGQEIGLDVVVDPNATADYMVVGAGSSTTGTDCPSALYYCPLVTDEGSTTLLFTGDPLSLNPNYGAINRYALVIAPDLDQEQGPTVKSLDRINACGKVKLARAGLVTFVK